MVCDCVILAAGLGTRMKSDQPKVLHTIGGKPLLAWAVAAAREAAGGAAVVIVPPGDDTVRQAAGDGVRFVEQAERLGTGHALLQAAPALREGSASVLVTSADLPLLRPETLRRLIDGQQANDGPITLLTAVAEQPRGFGRLVRDGQGRPQSVIEEAHATPAQRLIRELNAGAYCFRAAWLWDTLPHLPLSPKGEYYLTDLVALASQQGGEIVCVEVEDPDEVIGINTREHLAQAEAALRRRINRRWMLEGVTLIDPQTTYIDPQVEIGQDTIILPNTHLQGATTIGRRCRLGPNTLVRDSSLGDSCSVVASVLEEARLDDEVDVGPFAHLRPGAHLMRGVHMGNFGEVKSSTLGPGVKMGHFSYVGDATIGEDVNIAAGVITCNFDGQRKNMTEIGAGAFIGSDTMLVAPLRVGRGARTGAGSVVTKDVPDHTLAVGAPARLIRKLEPEDGASGLDSGQEAG